MKKILLCFILLLSACAQKIDIQYDDSHTVMYEIDNDLEYALIIMKFDPKHEDILCSLRVEHRNYRDEHIDLSIVNKLISNNNNNIVNENDYVGTYEYSKLNQKEYGYHEVMNLSLYYDDKLSDATDLIEYLGLTSELNDSLLYKDELLESESFKYQWILKKGECSTYNIE